MVVIQIYDGGNYVYVKNLVVTSDMLNQIIALRFDGRI